MMKEGSKYYPLYRYLRERDTQSVTLTFDAIEALLGAPLPKTSTSRGWWSNRSKGALQALAWSQAGYDVTHIDIKRRVITFTKPKTSYVARSVKGAPQWTGEMVEGLRRHMGLTQGELADELGMRQQTISEWERGVYQPGRATSKFLSMVAERANFKYTVEPDGS